MRFKHFTGYLLSLLLVLGVVSTVHAEQQGVSKNEIVVGTHTALSGPAAGWGIEVMNASRMRFDEINSTGGIHGRKIRYIAEDSQYRVPIAVQKANKLIHRDKVFVMLSAMGTPHNQAVFKTMFGKNIHSLFPYAIDRTMVEPLHKLKYQSIASMYRGIRGGVKYFVEKRNRKRVCAAYIDTDSGYEIVTGVKDQLKAMNMKLIAETTHKVTETNFVTPVTKLMKAKCDLVVMGMVIKDTIIFTATARKMGWKVDLMGGTASASSIVAKMGGKAVEGLYAASTIPIMYPDQATGKAKTFFENYKARYGKYPSEVAQLGYLNADLLVLGLQKAGRNLTADSLGKGLESIKNYKQMFGGPNMNFGPRKHLGANEALLLQIQNGRWVSPTGKKLVLSY